MQTYRGIVRSKNRETVVLCQKVARQIGLSINIEPEVADFLLDLQIDDYQVAIFDFTQIEQGCLQWVKLIRCLRPKLPLIVLCDEIDRETESRMYEEKIFYLGLRPLDSEVFRDVITASMKYAR
ncbi:MAG: hypothetical protein ACE5HI_03560 [bacterium]